MTGQIPAPWTTFILERSVGKLGWETVSGESRASEPPGDLSFCFLSGWDSKAGANAEHRSLCGFLKTDGASLRPGVRIRGGRVHPAKVRAQEHKAAQATPARQPHHRRQTVLLLAYASRSREATTPVTWFHFPLAIGWARSRVAGEGRGVRPRLPQRPREAAVG